MDIYQDIFSKKGLSLERLHSFYKIAKAGGFNKAAGSNPSTQSLFSKQIAELEKYLGFQIFARTGRKITLTNNGKALLGMITAFFAEFGTFMKEGAGRKIDLKISAGASAIDIVLPHLIDEKILQISNIDFEDHTTLETEAAVSSYDAAFGIVGREIKNKAFYIKKLLTSPTVMIYSKKNKAKYYLGDDLLKLSKNPTILLSDTSTFKTQILELFGKQRPNIVFGMPSFSLIKAYVGRGMGVSYVPGYCLAPADKELIEVYSSPRLKNCERSLYLIARKNSIDSSATLQEVKRLIEVNAEFFQKQIS